MFKHTIIDNEVVELTPELILRRVFMYTQLVNEILKDKDITAKDKVKAIEIIADKINQYFGE